MGGETEEQIIAAIEAEFEGWHVWKGVAGGWYARRPKTSPPRVAGPVPLEELRAAVAAKVAESQQRRYDGE